MGASGVKLFDDDLAADVLDLFVERLKQGRSGAQATKAVIDDFEGIVGTEEESVFWLALAFVQWEYGMLQRRVLTRALEVIDDGSDLARWRHAPQLERKRRKLLERLRDQLTSRRPNPKSVRVRKRLPPRCEWREGDVFSYRLPSGHYLLMRVIAVRDNVDNDLPLCELLDWLGEDLPDRDVIGSLPIRRNKRYPSESAFNFPMLKKYLSRCQTLGIHSPPVLPNDGSYVLPIDFRQLPSQLEEYFGMSIDNYRPQTGSVS
jgi:hypothetical protein